MLFYTGTTLAAAMYIVGAVEIALVSRDQRAHKAQLKARPVRMTLINGLLTLLLLLLLPPCISIPCGCVKYIYLLTTTTCPYRPQTYIAPWLSIFGDFTKDASIMYNNFRVYGTILLLVMGKENLCLCNPSDRFTQIR